MSHHAHKSFPIIVIVLTALVSLSCRLLSDLGAPSEATEAPEASLSIATEAPIAIPTALVIPSPTATPRPLSASPYKTFQADDSVWGLAWSPDNRFLLIQKYGKDLTVWAVEDNQTWPPINDNGSLVRAFSGAWSPDGRYLAVYSRWDLYIMDPMAAKTMFSYESGSFITNIAWSPDSHRMAFVVDNDTLYILNSDKLQIDSSSTLFNGIQYITFSPDGTTLAIMSEAGLNTFDVNRSEITSVHDYLISPSWSPDGRLLAGHFWENLNILDPVSGQIRSANTPDYHGIGPNQVQWSPEGEFIVSVHEDYSVRLWRANDLNQVITLTGAAGPAICVAWSADGRYFAVGDDTGLVTIFQLD